MTATIELSSARRKLQQALGGEGDPRKEEYFRRLKAWFRKRATKEEFDADARRLLPPDGHHLHNEFLLAVLNKCQTLANMSPATVAISTAASSMSPAANPSPAKVLQQQQVELTSYSPKRYDLLSPPSGNETSSPIPVSGSDRLKRGKIKRKSKSGRATFDQRFQPVPTSAAEELEEAKGVREEEKRLKYCHREPPLLPDSALIHGRLLVAAWETGELEGVEEDGGKTVEVMVRAVEQQLRRVVMALVMRRRGFAVRDGRFPHAVGVPRPNPWLFNTQRRRRAAEAVTEVMDTLERLPSGTPADTDPLVPAGRPTAFDAEQASLYQVACAADEGDSARGPISPSDLLAVLLEKKSVVPCHTVYALNVERTIARINHRGHDE